MILLIQICAEKLHYLEFVKPIEDVLKRNNFDFETVHYKNLSQENLSKSEGIIISGTSLKDNKFLDDIECFEFIKDFDKPILGICGGMHILGLVYGGKLKKFQEIGLKEIKLKEEFLGLNGTVQVYELHNYYVEPVGFDIVARSKNCVQIVKHKNKPFYGVLFHPEVRNKDLISNFVKLS